MKRLLTMFLTLLVCVLSFSVNFEKVNAEGEPDYLTFTAVENTTVSFSINGTLDTDPTLQYSKNNGAWQDYTFTSPDNSIDLNAGETIRFKAKNSTNSSFSKSGTDYIFFRSTNKVSASGNVMSLIDSTCSSTTIPNDYCFSYLFYNCSTLTTAPSLPATTITKGCYYGMFEGCSSLKYAPELLPATTLKEECYQRMFNSCTDLINAPELPATTLDKRCYKAMFAECSSLEEAPELPATNLADECYNSMFNYCTSLIEAPDLPAKVMTEGCYSNMFCECGNLIVGPEMFPTTLATGCFEYMFGSCSNLNVQTVANASRANVILPGAGNLEDEAPGMFQGTQNITEYDTPAGNYLVGLRKLKASNFNYVAPTNLTVDGNEKTVTITEKDPSTGVTNIAFKYYKDNVLLDGAPKEAGTYTVKIDVTCSGTSDYASKNGLTDSTWTFTLVELLPEPANEDENDVPYTEGIGFETEITKGEEEIRTVHIKNAEVGDSVVIKYGDKTLVKDVDYTITEGSIKINFLPAFLKTLPVGETNNVTISVKGTEFNLNIDVKEKLASSGGKDTTCEAVIGPRWHWDSKTKKCVEYSVINTGVK